MRSRQRWPWVLPRTQCGTLRSRREPSLRSRGSRRKGGPRLRTEGRSDRPQRRDHSHPLVADRARSSQQDRELYGASRPRGAEFPGDEQRSAARRYFRRAAPGQSRSFGRRRARSQLTLLPQIEPNGLMHMTGFFPSVPAQVKFDLAYAPVDGQWKLFGISVGLGQSGPAAPAPAPAAAAPQAAAPAAAAAAAAKKPKLKDKEQQQQ